MTSIFQTEKYFLVTTWILVSHGGRGKKRFCNKQFTRNSILRNNILLVLRDRINGKRPKELRYGDVPFKKETLKATNVLFCICAFKFFN